MRRGTGMKGFFLDPEQIYIIRFFDVGDLSTTFTKEYIFLAGSIIIHRP
jgi:hypothetical protein